MPVLGNRAGLKTAGRGDKAFEISESIEPPRAAPPSEEREQLISGALWGVGVMTSAILAGAPGYLARRRRLDNGQTPGAMAQMNRREICLPRVAFHLIWGHRDAPTMRAAIERNDTR